ncbi:MAG: hypothetical protein AB1656_27175 [Candidatus Omnitrophota bacterium]
MICQGQISFGAHTQLTYLGSCVSIIIFSLSRNAAGLSHVVGHVTQMGKYNLAWQVLDYYQQVLSKFGTFEYYLIGGSDFCKHVLQETEDELAKRRIQYTKLDVLGNYYRRVLILPKERTIKLFKKVIYQPFETGNR